MKVCAQCGVLSQGAGRPCVGCSAPAGERLIDVPERPPGVSWARLKGQFICRSCGFRSAIGTLDVDGGLRCVHCGIDQAFEVSRWSAALSKAHDVADLGGAREWSDEGKKAGQLPLEWSCAAGHPLCRACGGLLGVEGDSEGLQLATRCSSCGERRAYSLSEEARVLYSGLVLAVDEEHRAEGNQAEVVRHSSAAVAIQCPMCHAPLSVTGVEPLETCAHCGASVRVPAELREGKGGAETAGPLWLLFRGTSSARGVAENKAILEASRREAEAGAPGAPQHGATIGASAVSGGATTRGMIITFVIIGLFGVIFVFSLIVSLMNSRGLEASGSKDQGELDEESSLREESAKLLFRGQIMDDHIDQPSGRDYIFDVDRRGEYAFTVEGSISVGAELYRRSGGERVAVGHTDGPGEQVLTAQLEPGPYRLRVRPYRPVTEPSGNVHVLYDLHNAVHLGVSVLDVEVGAVETNNLDGDLPTNERGRPYLTYLLRVGEAGEYQIDARADDCDLALRLGREDLLVAENDDRAPDDRQPLLDLRLEPGRYTVEVSTSPEGVAGGPVRFGLLVSRAGQGPPQG